MRARRRVLVFPVSCPLSDGLALSVVKVRYRIGTWAEGSSALAQQVVDRAAEDAAYPHDVSHHAMLDPPLLPVDDLAKGAS